MTSMVINNLTGCARCGETHTHLEFQPLTSPMVLRDVAEFSWWALCPINGEPILLGIIATEGEAEGCRA